MRFGIKQHVNRKTNVVNVASMFTYEACLPTQFGYPRSLTTKMTVKLKVNYAILLGLNK